MSKSMILREEDRLERLITSLNIIKDKAVKVNVGDKIEDEGLIEFVRVNVEGFIKTVEGLLRFIYDIYMDDNIKIEYSKN